MLHHIHSTWRDDELWYNLDNTTWICLFWTFFRGPIFGWAYIRKVSENRKLALGLFLESKILSSSSSSIVVQVFDTPQVSTVLRSNLMRLYFPVDLTGNLIMIEKLVSGGTWTGDLPIFSPTR